MSELKTEVDAGKPFYAFRLTSLIVIGCEKLNAVKMDQWQQ
jgi:hypothetical protein